MRSRTGLIGLALLTQAAPAFAHAFLERANPPVGSEIAASPPAVSITFTEGVEPLFSTIEVHGPMVPQSPRAHRMSRPTTTEF
jgi:methionine-rich copper-binding protein CopC